MNLVKSRSCKKGPGPTLLRFFLPSFQKKLSKEWSVSWRPPKSQEFYIVSFWLKWVSLLKTNQQSLSIWTRLTRLLVNKAAQFWQLSDELKFNFSENATKIWVIVLMVLTFTKKMSKAQGLLRKFLWPSQKNFTDNFFDLISNTVFLCNKNKSQEMTAR